MARAEELDIVIVGGGICGLATALAVHRKGIKSVVVERSEVLRATGAAITVLANGWRALHQLRLDSTLRATANSFHRIRDVCVDKGVVRETCLSEGEARCLKRVDLIEALANELPYGTIRFGCRVLSINVESSSSNLVLLQLHDGRLIKSKVLIGCDGANSIVANFIGLKPAQPSSKSQIRGLATYPNGHGFPREFLKVRKNNHVVGRIPIDEKTVYWFIAIQRHQRDVETSKDPISIRQLALNLTIGLSMDVVEMIKNSDLSSLSLTRLRFRAPWNLLLGNFRKGSITVAGDAWHVFHPSLGQSGSAALEDAIVLARCLSKKIYNFCLSKNIIMEQTIQEALDEYLKERSPRVLYLSTLTYIRGVLLVGHPSLLLRLMCMIITTAFFRDTLKHTRYDCGKL